MCKINILQDLDLCTGYNKKKPKTTKCELFHCSIQIPGDINEWEWFHNLGLLSDESHSGFAWLQHTQRINAHRKEYQKKFM